MEGLEYEVSLADKMSGPAHEAAESLHALAKGAEHGKGALSELAGGFIKTVEPAEVLKGAFEGIGAGLKSFAAGLKSGEVKEMIGGVTESFAGLAQTLDLVIPGLGQAAAAFIKVVGGIVGVTAGLVQEGVMLAIESTQAKLAMIDMFAALGGGINVGKETEEMLSSLSEEIGITKDQLAPLTKSFMAMGIQGTEALRKVTLAAASAQAIMGDPAAAHSFETLTKKIQVAVQTGQGLKIPAKGLGSLADMGIRVDDVAQRMNVSAATLSQQLKNGTVNAAAFGDALQDALIDKGAGPLQRMGSSLANMKKMFGQSIEDLFEDMGDAIQPVLAQVKSFLGIFSQSTNSGKAMKAGIGGALTYVFGVLAKTILPIKHFFLDLVIWSLKTYIAIKPHWTQIQKVLSFAGDAVAFVASNFASLVGGVFEAVAAVSRFASVVSGSIDYLKMIGTATLEAGKSFVDGFVDGISQGVDRVKDAAANLATSAKDSVKNFLGIHSPSQVMFQLGGHTSAGFAAGVGGGSDKVASASAKVGASAAVGMTQHIRASDYAAASAGPAPTSGRDSGGGKGMAVDGGIHITITAPNGVTNALDLTETAVALIFERMALQRGT